MYEEDGYASSTHRQLKQYNYNDIRASPLLSSKIISFFPRPKNMCTLQTKQDVLLNLTLLAQCNSSHIV